MTCLIYLIVERQRSYLATYKHFFFAKIFIFLIRKVPSVSILNQYSINATTPWTNAVIRFEHGPCPRAHCQLQARSTMMMLKKAYSYLFILVPRSILYLKTDCTIDNSLSFIIDILKEIACIPLGQQTAL